MAAAAEAQMPFIKNLASSDRKLRTQSLSTLQNYLSSRTSLSAPDAFKLWTGLYYALWMTDRPRPQQALATDLANLLLDVQTACAAPFLGGFWAVLSRQWSSIDALRMDKFLLLVRRVFGVHVRYAREKGWRGDEAARVLDVLGTQCFDVHEDGVALGLRLHVLDLWVDELEKEKALGDGPQGKQEGEDEDESRREWVRKVGDLVDALRSSPVKSVRTRARESYDDERLPWGTRKDGEESGEEDEADDEDDQGWGGIED